MIKSVKIKVLCKKNKVYYAKRNFNQLIYNQNTFKKSYIKFKTLEKYNIDKENENFICINGSIFRKFKEDQFYDVEYIYDYFYNESELRKIKIKKLNESR
jgi:hypothetical protein